jgi:hypothetical protein
MDLFSINGGNQWMVYYNNFFTNSWVDAILAAGFYQHLIEGINAKSAVSNT